MVARRGRRAGRAPGALHLVRRRADRPAGPRRARRLRALAAVRSEIGSHPPARALFGVPGRELSDRIVAFDDLLGRDARLLVDELAHTAGWPARFAVLDAFLLARLAVAPAFSPDVEWAWPRLVTSGGAVPIAALVRELGCSGRHLATRFGEDVGMTPKADARVLRVERAVLRLRGGDDELGRIAADCGFSDQSHFTHELRAFSGVTPTALLAERQEAGFVI